MRMADNTDQSDIIEFLGKLSTHDGRPVERIETHSAVVFLVGDRAYKLKRAASFPFLDFSTCERRGDFCRREVEFNQRTAPHIYIEALPITRDSASGLAINGNGEVVDWIVAMKRFEQDDLLDQIAMNGDLPNELLAEIADKIARFHDACEMTPEHGGYDAMQWIFDDNTTEMRAYPDILDPVLVARLAQRSRQVMATVGARLDRRRQTGFVRHCHGDLHLQNIFLDDGQPTLFDCIEFNDKIACIDVMYDLAFLLMDLAHRDRPDAANFVLNRYLARTGDFDGAALLPLFLSCRAAIRAKVGAIASKEHPELANRHWPIPSPLRSERSLAPFWSAPMSSENNCSASKSSIAYRRALTTTRQLNEPTTASSRYRSAYCRMAFRSSRTPHSRTKLSVMP
ncbi:MAG: hypothetical protein CMM59_19355 [Rhodospirillaceae bacterium]|nr:hypothetical protein [Rhodospirillaceae bacterium]